MTVHPITSHGAYVMFLPEQIAETDKRTAITGIAGRAAAPPALARPLMVGNFDGSACATRGHAAAPPTKMMNSRRLTCCLKAQDRTSYRRKLVPGKGRCPLWAKSGHYLSSSLVHVYSACRPT